MLVIEKGHGPLSRIDPFLETLGKAGMFFSSSKGNKSPKVAFGRGQIRLPSNDGLVLIIKPAQPARALRFRKMTENFFSMSIH